MMQFNLITQNQLRDIHAASLRILSDVGIKIQTD